MNNQVATLGRTTDTLINLAIRFGPRLLTAVLILIAGFIVGRYLSRWFAGVLARRELEPPVRLLVSRVVWALCVALFAIMALQNLGVELLPLIAGLSVVGAGVALATQGVLGNMVAGLSIIFSKPFRVGEYISIAGVEGTVQSVTLFSTTLTHVDQSRVVIPNRKIVGEILHNYGRMRQLDLAVGVAYGTDLNQTLAVILGVLIQSPRVLKDPAPLIGVTMLLDSAIQISVRPWVAVTDYVAAGPEIYTAVI